MNVLRRIFDLSLAASLLASVAACGHNVPLRPALNGAQAAASHGLGARETAWFDDTVMLEDFSSKYRRYDMVGDVNPFFNTPIATVAPRSNGSVLEILAPANESKMRRGAYLTFDVGNGQTYNESSKPPYAPHVMLSFDWANNGVPVAGHAVYAEAIFVFSYAVEGHDDQMAAIAYAWTNDPAIPTNTKDNWIATTLPTNPPIEMRILPIQVGVGGVGMPPVPQPCSANALNGMVLQSVTRQLEKDVAIAYADSLPLLTSSFAAATESVNDGASAADPNRPDERYLNQRITGIAGIGAGADLPQGICSHAIFDNFRMVRRKAATLAAPAGALASRTTERVPPKR